MRYTWGWLRWRLFFRSWLHLKGDSVYVYFLICAMFDFLSLSFVQAMGEERKEIEAELFKGIFKELEVDSA